MKTINTGKLYGYDKRKAMEAEETVMLYSHRVYFKGEAAPIGFNSGLSLVGLVDKHGEDNVLYIEDMLMKPSIDKVMEALSTGVVAGFTFMDGSYYIEEGQWKRGTQVITEMDMRRRLQQHYKEDPAMIEEDISYIEDNHKVIQSC